MCLTAANTQLAPSYYSAHAIWFFSFGLVNNIHNNRQVFNVTNFLGLKQCWGSQAACKRFERLFSTLYYSLNNMLCLNVFFFSLLHGTTNSWVPKCFPICWTSLGLNFFSAHQYRCKVIIQFYHPPSRRYTGRIGSGSFISKPFSVGLCYKYSSLRCIFS